jgi:enoyl-[acyl-carrier-protein] reductase (NADH)
VRVHSLFTTRIKRERCFAPVVSMTRYPKIAGNNFGNKTVPNTVLNRDGPYGIRVNCIAPETILTERNLERIPNEQLASLVDTHPLKRLGTPEDVACAAVFLTSDEVGWITGIVLDVAGGAVMLR